MGPSAVGRSFSVRMGPPDPPRRQDPAVRHQQGNTVDNSRSEFTTEVGASQRSAQARTDDNTQGPLDSSAGQGKTKHLIDLFNQTKLMNCLVPMTMWKKMPALRDLQILVPRTMWKKITALRGL